MGMGEWEGRGTVSRILTLTEQREGAESKDESQTTKRRCEGTKAICWQQKTTFSTATKVVCRNAKFRLKWKLGKVVCRSQKTTFSTTTKMIRRK